MEQRQHAVEEQVFRQVPLDVFADGLQGGESPFQGAVVRLQVQITGKAIVSLVELTAFSHGDAIGAVVSGRVLETALVLSILPFSLVKLLPRGKPVGCLLRFIPVGNVVQHKGRAVLLVGDARLPRGVPENVALPEGGGDVDFQLGKELFQVVRIQGLVPEIIPVDKPQGPGVHVVVQGEDVGHGSLCSHRAAIYDFLYPHPVKAAPAFFHLHIFHHVPIASVPAF